MRKHEFGLYCLVILFAWFLLFGVFCSLVCFKTFDKHAKIWNKWKKFNKERHCEHFESVLFIIYWKTLALINKQTGFIASVMHRLCTFLSQNVSREQGRCSLCHELLIQGHTVVALCKTYTRLGKKKQNRKKGNKGRRISLVVHEANCFPHRKNMNMRIWCSPNSRGNFPGVKSLYEQCIFPVTISFLHTDKRKVFYQCMLLDESELWNWGYLT